MNHSAKDVIEEIDVHVTRSICHLSCAVHISVCTHATQILQSLGPVAGLTFQKYIVDSCTYNAIPKLHTHVTEGSQIIWLGQRRVMVIGQVKSVPSILEALSVQLLMKIVSIH